MKKKANIKSNSIQNIINHDAHLQAEEVEDRVKLPQNSMWITCMKKKAKFKSYSIQNIMMVTFMQKMLKKKSLKNAMEVTCKQKVGKYKVQHSPEHRGDHLHAEKGRDKVQHNVTMVITYM